MSEIAASEAVGLGVPRSASGLMGLLDDPLWRRRLRAACLAVTGKAPESAENAVHLLIAERTARKWKPTAFLGIKAAEAMTRGAIFDFWESVDEAVAEFDRMCGELNR